MHGVKLLFLLAVVLWAPGTATCAGETPRTLVIAAGDVRGLYFAFATSLCGHINLDRNVLQLRCVVESTEGSVENIDLVEIGRADFAITQGDVFADHSRRGAKARYVIPLYDEVAHIFVREGLAIDDLTGLQGLQVGVSSFDSGTRYAFSKVVDRLSLRDVREVHTGSLYEIIRRFCFGEIDVVFFVSGLGNEFSHDLVSRCSAGMLSVSKESLKQLISEDRNLHKLQIPEGYYRNRERIDSFGPKAILIASEQLPEDLLQTVMSVISSHLVDLRNVHPAFAQLGDLVKNADELSLDDDVAE